MQAKMVILQKYTKTAKIQLIYIYCLFYWNYLIFKIIRINESPDTTLFSLQKGWKIYISSLFFRTLF